MAILRFEFACQLSRINGPLAIRAEELYRRSPTITRTNKISPRVKNTSTMLSHLNSLVKPCTSDYFPVPSTTRSVWTYSVVNHNEGHPLPDTHELIVRVRAAYGNSYHRADEVESGQLAFTAPENGDCMACFRTPDHEL